MEGSINREDLDVSYRVKINPETVQQCISEMENFKIGDREKYYTKCILERFDKCNDSYVKDFDNSLNKLSENLFNEEEFNYYEFKRLLKASTKLTSDIYDRYIELIYSLK